MTIEDQAAFQITGIAARVSNARMDLIGALWGRFMAEDTLARIPHALDSRIVAAYTDYESDENGAFTLVLGARVSPGSPAPPGMRAVEIPDGRYAVFTSETGPPEKVVSATWQRIWKEPVSAAYKRAFRTDFESYETAGSPGAVRVGIHISLAGG